MKLPDNAMYFTINVIGRHSSLSVYLHDVEPVWQDNDPFKGYAYFGFDAKTRAVDAFMDSLDDDCCDTEERYPNDTWVSLAFYDQAFTELARYDGSCENDYYCSELDMDIKDAVKQFLKDYLT